MFEKVNPDHPDKIADRIAGALVNMAYEMEENPRIAVEVLIGHGKCTIIAESSVELPHKEVERAVHRIMQSQSDCIEFRCIPQDRFLAKNQEGKIRCGDNGIFRGAPTTDEQRKLTQIGSDVYEFMYEPGLTHDGKYLIGGDRLIICQSGMYDELRRKFDRRFEKTFDGMKVEINPIGYWTGGTYVDSGATNRKLGSDMGDGITGGGLHGKDLSKADVSVNIYAFLKAQELGRPVEFACAIGDETVGGVPYEEIVETARNYIKSVGGFEKFAEWGLIRPTA